MRILPYLVLLVFLSCSKENINGSVDCTDSDCGILNDYNIIAYRSNNEVEINIGIYKYIDAGVKVCKPDAADIYMSTDNINFQKVDRLFSAESSLVIPNLDNDKTYYFQVVSLHCELDSIVSDPIMIKPGPINIPNATDNFLGASYDKFDISDDRSKIIFRNASDNWYSADYGPVSNKNKFIQKSFNATWMPDNTHVAYINIVRQDNYLYSESIRLYNVATQKESILYTIENIGEYGMSGIDASIDGNSIFFYSRKENGEPDGKYYSNIWKLDSSTQNMTRLTDFYPIDFDMRGFVEDPKNPNNFYVVGGAYEPYSNLRKHDIYYWNIDEQSLTPVLLDNFEDKIEGISPDGEKLLLESYRSGRHEYWVYNTVNEEIIQATDRQHYGDGGHFISNAKWIDDNTFLVYMNLEGNRRFAEFRVE